MTPAPKLVHKWAFRASAPSSRPVLGRLPGLGGSWVEAARARSAISPGASDPGDSQHVHLLDCGLSYTEQWVTPK